MDKIIPGFILKLWKMINDPKCEVLKWSDNGQSFIITDASKFCQELSKYYKHNNLSSFIRQLNMYGFRKVATIENITGTEDLHFYHNNFIQNRPELLERIKRKLPQKSADAADFKNLSVAIVEIQNKQIHVSQSVSDLQRQNIMLSRELDELRQKYQQQQSYIGTLMKLVSEAMKQNGIKTNILPIKHNSPLMIEGADSGSQIVMKSRPTRDDGMNALYDVSTIDTTNPITDTISYDGQAQQQTDMQQAFELQQDIQQELQQDLQQELQQDLQQELQDLPQELQIQTDLAVDLQLQPTQQQEPMATTSAYEIPPNTTTTNTTDGGDYQEMDQGEDCNVDQIDLIPMYDLDRMWENQ